MKKFMLCCGITILLLVAISLSLHLVFWIFNAPVNEVSTSQPQEAQQTSENKGVYHEVYHIAYRAKGVYFFAISEEVFERVLPYQVMRDWNAINEFRSREIIYYLRNAEEVEVVNSFGNTGIVLVRVKNKTYRTDFPLELQGKLLWTCVDELYQYKESIFEKESN